jgi:hypothetical protein
MSEWPGMDGPVREMRSARDSDEIRSCKHCQHAFVPRAPHQAYCSDDCRAAFHKNKRENGPAGIRGQLFDMRPLKGGKWSVIVHVDAVEAAALVKLQKGALLGLVE